MERCAGGISPKSGTWCGFFSTRPGSLLPSCSHRGLAAEREGAFRVRAVSDDQSDASCTGLGRSGSIVEARVR